jgi:hypothetical protein
MHDNAIHDLALACWSELVSPIKRAVSLSNRSRLRKVPIDCSSIATFAGTSFPSVAFKSQLSCVRDCHRSLENQNDQLSPKYLGE